MRSILPVKRLISCVVLSIGASFTTNPAFSLDFSLGDLRTEMQIVQDYASGSLDLTSLTEQARHGLEHPWGPPNSREILMGRLIEVCPTLSVINDNGHQFQFRSKHEGGDADWLVTLSPVEKTVISNVLIIVIPTGADSIGAPFALPPMPPGARLIPPGGLCLSPEELSLLEQRQEEACAAWPDLCPAP